jgi:hypothetical protein
MTRTVKPARGGSKTPVPSKGSGIRIKGKSIHPAIAAFKTVFPQGAAAELTVRTRASFSYCEKVLAGIQQPGERMITALLRSDVGREILIALVGDAKPTWWVGFSRHLQLAALVKAAAQTQKSIEAMQREMAE